MGRTTAAARRFRPIVLTTLTTAMGLTPLLFEKSPQAQFLIPMGVSLGFGIVISGFMVIFVTPAVAAIIEDLHGYRPATKSVGEPPEPATVPNTWTTTSRPAQLSVKC